MESTTSHDGPRRADASTHAKSGFQMTIAAGFQTSNDVLCKLLMPTYPSGEIIAIRSIFILIIIGIGRWRGNPGAPLFKNKILHALRAIVFGVSTMLFLGGLGYMPLTNAIALSFMSPLFVAVLSPFFLGEHVNLKCWTAIAIGFVGALFILSPSIRQFGWPSILPALSAVTSASVDMMTRRMSSTESNQSFMVSAAWGALIVSLSAVAWGGWRWPDAVAVATILATSLSMLLFYYFMIEALRRTPAFVVTPFRYSALVWGVLVSIFVWGELPSIGVLFGSAILAVCGVYLGSGHWSRSSADKNPVELAG
jgi:drug/metabolite transporter (DMT)-like permease